MGTAGLFLGYPSFIQIRYHSKIRLLQYCYRYVCCSKEEFNQHFTQRRNVFAKPQIENCFRIWDAGYEMQDVA